MTTDYTIERQVLTTGAAFHMGAFPKVKRITRPTPVWTIRNPESGRETHYTQRNHAHDQYQRLIAGHESTQDEA